MLQPWLITIKNKQSIIWWWLTGLVTVAILFSLIQPFKYEATSRILVVPDYQQTSDPYQISRTNEYLSSLLAQVAYSSSFFEATVKPEYQIDTTYFGDTAKKRMDIWQKTINIKAVEDSGIISVRVYHPDKQQAQQLVRAINYNLITKNDNYHGLGSRVSLKIIDQPIVSSWPVKPNLPLYIALAIILGGVFALAQIYLSSSLEQFQLATTTTDQTQSILVTKDKPVSTETIKKREVKKESSLVKGASDQSPLIREKVRVVDGHDITEQLIKGGNIDNIFAS